MSREIIAALDEAKIGIASSTYDVVGMPPIQVQLTAPGSAISSATAAVVVHYNPARKTYRMKAPSTTTWLFAAMAASANLGSYLVFAANTGFRELIAAILVAPIATMATYVFASAAKIRFRFGMLISRTLRQVPWQVIVGTVTVYKALAKQILAQTPADSLLCAARFDCGTPRDLTSSRLCACHHLHHGNPQLDRD